MFTFDNINVISTSNRPLSAEEWSKLAADKIIYVGEETEGPIKDQAVAYKHRIQKIIEYYIAQAVTSHEKHLLQRKF